MRVPLFCTLVLVSCGFVAHAQEFYVVEDAHPQPLIAQAQRIATALDQVGRPLAQADAARLAALADAPHDAALARAVQDVLDPYCLAMVHINPEMRVKAARGPADARLTQGGWSTFLVKVHNESGTQAALQVRSPQAEPALFPSSGRPEPKPENLLTPGQVANRFLELELYRRRPMAETLLGGDVEYQILLAYTNVTGPREAQVSFDVGAGTEDLGYRSALAFLFQCEPSAKLVFASSACSSPRSSTPRRASPHSRP